MNSSHSVSYTHLDVYKRQVKDNVGHAFKIDKEAENDMKFLKVLSDKCEVFSRADVNLSLIHI